MKNQTVLSIIFLSAFLMSCVNEVRETYVVASVSLSGDQNNNNRVNFENGDFLFTDMNYSAGDTLRVRGKDYDIIRGRKIERKEFAEITREKYTITTEAAGYWLDGRFDFVVHLGFDIDHKNNEGHDLMRALSTAEGVYEVEYLKHRIMINKAKKYDIHRSMKIIDSTMKVHLASRNKYE